MAPHELSPKLRALLGSVISDRYEVLEVLGQGAMATVFLARQRGLERKVAVKVLCPTLATTQEYADRFTREAQSLARLDHPNCLRVFDHGVTDDGLHFLVTELVPGVELRSRVTGPTSETIAIPRIQMILAGLEHAHAKGVVHRDLKPDNILVSHHGNGVESLKIVDFGIAKLLRPPTEGPATAVGIVFGTPQYMSPEQAAGQPVDHRTDLYAVGMLMYAMLAGAPAFDGDDPLVIARSQVHRAVPPLPCPVSPRLERWIERMLEKDPDRRYPSAAAALEALDAIESGEELADTMRLEDHGRVSRPLRSWLPAMMGVGTLALGLAIAAAVGTPDQAEIGPEGRRTTVRVEDVDQALARGDASRAREVLAALIDERPNDAQLLWRDGQALVALGRPRRALARFDQALAEDASLQEDPVRFAELDALLRRPSLRQDALDVAMQRLEDVGDPFLVGLINDAHSPLPFVDRHRILERLRPTDHFTEIDVDLQARLDLVQAADAPDPCAAYLMALDAFGEAPSTERLEMVARVELPEGEDEDVCEEARARREMMVSALEVGEEVEEALEDAVESAEAFADGEQS